MKTIKVRIALVVNASGQWASGGWESGDDAEKMDIALDTIAADGTPEVRYWVTVEVPVPNEMEVQAVAEKV